MLLQVLSLVEGNLLMIALHSYPRHDQSYLVYGQSEWALILRRPLHAIVLCTMMQNQCPTLCRNCAQTQKDPLANNDMHCAASQVYAHADKDGHNRNTLQTQLYGYHTQVCHEQLKI